MDGRRRRRNTETQGLRHRSTAEACTAGGTDLSPAMRGRLVDGHTVDRFSARRADQACRAHRQRHVRRVRDALRPHADARTAPACSEMALHRGLATGRSDESAHAALSWVVRRGSAEPKRRAGARCRALEIRLQESQIAGKDSFCRAAALYRVESRGTQRIHHARPRHMGADLSTDHAFGYAVAPAHRMERTLEVTPHAWTVRILLRRTALPELRLVGPILRLASHLEGCDEAALHHGGVCHLRSADPARCDFHQCNGETAWGKAVAVLAPARLYHRDRRGPALLVAGQTRHHAAAHLRRAPGGFARLPRGPSLRERNCKQVGLARTSSTAGLESIA